MVAVTHDALIIVLTDALFKRSFVHASKYAITFLLNVIMILACVMNTISPYLRIENHRWKLLGTIPHWGERIRLIQKRVWGVQATSRFLNNITMSNLPRNYRRCHELQPRKEVHRCHLLQHWWAVSHWCLPVEGWGYSIYHLDERIDLVISEWEVLELLQGLSVCAKHLRVATGSVAFNNFI